MQHLTNKNRLLLNLVALALLLIMQGCDSSNEAPPSPTPLTQSTNAIPEETNTAGTVTSPALEDIPLVTDKETEVLALPKKDDAAEKKEEIEVLPWPEEDGDEVLNEAQEETIEVLPLPEEEEILPLPEEVEEEPDDLRVHYYTSDNKYSIDITIEFGEIRYTFFNDPEGKCRNWKKSKPCWTRDDLQQVAAALQQDELDNLMTIIEQSQVLKLGQKEYGDKQKDGKRHQRKEFKIFFNDLEREYSYYSTPAARKKPEALAMLETALLQYARNLEGEYQSETIESVQLPNFTHDENGDIKAGAE